MKAWKTELRTAQKALEASQLQGVLKKGFKPHRKGEYFFIPITRKLAGVKGLLCQAVFEKRKERIDVKAALGPKASGSFDLVGSIAIIEDHGAAKNKAFAKAIMQLHPRIKTVAVKGETAGKYRVRPLETVAGIDTARTLHKENGCVFEVDLNREYFSSRLSFERKRVASLVGKNECVLALFAGVGPFPIEIAKASKTADVFAVEYNPNAVKRMRSNAKRNKVVMLIECADVKVVLSRKEITGWADRVLMTAPHNAKDFLQGTINSTKRGGIIHYYSFAASKDGDKELAKDARAACKATKRRFKRLGARVVSTFSAGKVQWVLDFQAF
ncbi:hypothetical protein AUJ14_05635 [Candidatus Micrarchaeota archaeon CG1_02_55_22]|nr:MAG: hypothetical protein AUJ14_05635 [Candidatus Micrarchaeota archaeon CG1_02_55_22]